MQHWDPAPPNDYQMIFLHLVCLCLFWDVWWLKLNSLHRPSDECSFNEGRFNRSIIPLDKSKSHSKDSKLLSYHHKRWLLHLSPITVWMLSLLLHIFFSKVADNTCGPQSVHLKWAGAQLIHCPETKKNNSLKHFVGQNVASFLFFMLSIKLYLLTCIHCCISNMQQCPNMVVCNSASKEVRQIEYQTMDASRWNEHFVQKAGCMEEISGEQSHHYFLRW